VRLDCERFAAWMVLVTYFLVLHKDDPSLVGLWLHALQSVQGLCRPLEVIGAGRTVAK